jgi:hypothetical protein
MHIHPLTERSKMLMEKIERIIKERRGKIN